MPSVRHGLGQATFAPTDGEGRDAPGADLRAPRVRLPSSTRTGLPRRRLAILSGKMIDQTRKVLAKLGVSLDGRSLYVTNLALDLRLAVSPDVQAIDS